MVPSYVGFRLCVIQLSYTHLSDDGTPVIIMADGYLCATMLD